jgi:hypothetical protein
VVESNSRPAIAGDDKCLSELGVDHVFDLTLTDADGDDISWRASKHQPHGVLTPSAGRALPSGSVIRLVYRPPSATEPDENWIDVTATDARGAVTRMTLYVRNR